jgi:geranylgeranyl pyrophosphate synthase
LGTYERGTLELDDEQMDHTLAPYARAVEEELGRHRNPNSRLGSMAYDFVQGGGKKLRPIIALLACESTSGSYKKALPIAAAYELAHSASLTQDDIIDNSPTRHNQPTAHTEHGVSVAILLSDMMIFDIFQRLADYGEIDITKEQLSMLIGFVARSAKEAAEGEYLEAELSKKQDVTLGDYERVAGLKTGALFAAAAASGAVVGGAKPRVVKDLYEYGLNLGVEFQMVDDVLDLTGSTKEMGKPMLKDLQNNASNIVVMHALAHADNKEKGRLRAMMKKSAYGMVDIEELLGMFDDLGSVEYAVRLGKKHAALARGRLKLLPRGRAKSNLEKITVWLEARRR